jgi:Tfp pilus assembly protein PilO
LDRHQVLILVLGAVMIASFLLLVLWPKQRELSVITSAVQRERELVEQKALAARTGQYMMAQIPELRKVCPAVERRLPPEPRLLDFLRAVAEQVDADPHLTHEVHCGEGVVAGPVPAVPVRLRLVGPFASVQRSIAVIERSARVCQFRRTHLARTEDGAVAAEAEVLVHYLPPSGATAHAAATHPAGGDSRRPGMLVAEEDARLLRSRGTPHEGPEG